MPAAIDLLNTPLRCALLLGLLLAGGAMAQAADPPAGVQGSSASPREVATPVGPAPASPAAAAVPSAEAAAAAAPVTPATAEAETEPSPPAPAQTASAAAAQAVTADPGVDAAAMPAGPVEGAPPTPPVTLPEPAAPGANGAETVADGSVPVGAVSAVALPAPTPEVPPPVLDPVPFAADADAAGITPAATPLTTPVDPVPGATIAVEPLLIGVAPRAEAASPAPSAAPTTPLPIAAPAASEALAPAAAAVASLAKVDPLAATLAPAPSAAPEMGPPSLIAEGDPTSPSFIGPPLVPPMKLLEEEVAPGSKRQLMWSAGSSFAGGDSVAPVNVVRGTRPGPVLCLTAAIHGDELNGVEIVRRILNDLNPDRLSGTVVAVPIVNMFGFTRSSRYLPDRRDLNRFFPGSQRGSIASRIAYSFFNEVARHCDYLVDFHTGSFERDNLPQVRADLRLPEVLRFARGFGALPVLHSDGSRGMLRVAATQVGIPSVTFEVGAPGVLQVAQIDAAAEAIDALAHHLGMVPDAPPPQDPQAIFYESQWVRANAGGLLISQVDLGEPVEPGQCLGIVVDPVRNVERRIESPIHGRVIGMARNQVVLPGFAAFHIGEATSAERASDAAASGLVEDVVEEDPDPAMERGSEL